MKRTILSQLIVLILAGSFAATAQPGLRKDSGRVTPELYIEMFKEAAIADMLKTGVPASITLAQGMYESDYGNSPLARSANNHFGIKCHKEWEGDTYHKDDDAPNECFRKYETVLQSYDDHSDFLRSRERYQELFRLEATDYKGWAHGLKKAGYATNPSYAHKLIDLIEKYRLNEFDVLAAKKPVKDEEVAVPVKTPAVKAAPVTTTASSSSADNQMVNGVPFVYARKGDTWTKLARENNIELWQVLEYNDAGKNDVLRENEMVYVKAKKNKSTELSHVYSEGDSMRSIAQQYGIKLARLYKMNEMTYGSEPETGTIIYLKRAMLFGVVL